MDNSKMPEKQFKKKVVRRHFQNPRECYTELAKLCGDKSGVINADRFLFRGEARYHPTSPPGMFRALTADTSLGVKMARTDATEIFVERYEDDGGDPELAQCLAQHYLSTSDCLDFSASLGVALAFALDEWESKKDRTAYIAVLHREMAESSPRFRLRDLRDEAYALRPVRQLGFVAVHHPGNFIDLKNDQCRTEIGLEWYSFTVASGNVVAERHRNAPRVDDLYDIKNDRFAWKMIAHLIGLINDPSPHWGEDGLQHLVDTLQTLFSRTSGGQGAAR